MAQFSIGEFIQNIASGIKAYRMKMYGTDGVNELAIKTNASGEILIGNGSVSLAKGTTSADGTPTTLIDTTKNFTVNAFTTKTAKVTIGGIEYSRSIVSNTASVITIDPIQAAASASVLLAGAGSLAITYIAVGDEGNNITIQLIAGTGVGQSMAHTFTGGNTLTITSPTDGAGAPQDILAGNLQTYIDTDPELSLLFDADNNFTAGALALMPAPVNFTGGQDAIAILANTPYEIIDYGVDKTTIVGATVAIPTDLQYHQLTDAESLPVKQTRRLINPAALELTDRQIDFANNAPQNTQVVLANFTKPEVPSQRHQIIVYNPSIVTDLTVKLFGIFTDLGTGTRDGFYDSFVVPKSQSVSGTTINTYVKEVEGLFAGTDVKIVVSNDTVLGASDTFSAYLRIISI